MVQSYPQHLSWMIILLFSAIIGIAFSANGNWSNWSDWQPCSASCDRGIRRRFRFCNNPPPTRGGNWCKGKRIDEESCEIPFGCPVDGGWSQWSLWSACSVSCGEGIRNKFRECDSPAPANNGKNCEGRSVETATCFAVKDCPRDGKWSAWSQWSPCSVTCGDNGSIFRYRSCNNPPPLADGKLCRGPNQQSKRCRAQQKCAVNGQWSEWTEWTSCSVSCGSGVISRNRRCDNPIPQNGGLDCMRTEAGEMQSRSCNGSIAFCPVNGMWSDWGGWGVCISPDCMNSKQPSYQFRQRSCNNPHPAHKGSMCQGTFTDAALCEAPKNCAVDGGWSEWSSWECTPFVGIRKRRCDNPPPMNGGKHCQGNKEQTYSLEDPLYADVCPEFDGKGDKVEGSDDEDLQGGSGSGSGQKADDDMENGDD